MDPLKEAKANQEAIALGVQTRSDIAAAQGKDLEEIFQQLKQEEGMAEEFGLILSTEKEQPVRSEPEEEEE